MEIVEKELKQKLQITYNWAYILTLQQVSRKYVSAVTFTYDQASRR